jgi:hypothetical protein
VQISRNLAKVGTVIAVTDKKNEIAQKAKVLFQQHIG